MHKPFFFAYRTGNAHTCQALFTTDRSDLSSIPIDSGMFWIILLTPLNTDTLAIIAIWAKDISSYLKSYAAFIFISFISAVGANDSNLRSSLITNRGVVPVNIGVWQ